MNEQIIIVEKGDYQIKTYSSMTFERPYHFKHQAPPEILHPSSEVSIIPFALLGTMLGMIFKFLVMAWFIK